VYTTVRMDDEPRRPSAVPHGVPRHLLRRRRALTRYDGPRPAEVVIAALKRYAAAGVSDLCLRFVGDYRSAQLERFTAEVLPAFRGCAGSRLWDPPCEGACEKSRHQK